MPGRRFNFVGWAPPTIEFTIDEQKKTGRSSPPDGKAKPLVESLKIIGLGVISAIAYGIAHDNVTARVCVEYFTIGHARIFGETESPTILAFGWGFAATWWVGLALGIFLALTCRLGRKPKLAVKDLLKPVGWLLLTMACVSLVAGFVGYHAASRRWIWLVGDLAANVPKPKHDAFLADAFAHFAAYGTAFLGGMTLAVWATIRRVRLAKPGPFHTLDEI